MLGAALAMSATPCEPPVMAEAAKGNDSPDEAASSGTWYGLREGEIPVELPERFDASLYFIGRIHTPWRERDECPKNARQSDAVCTIVVDPRWAKGLSGLETSSHIIVLYWMDQARRDLLVQSPRHYAERNGTFALRSPAHNTPLLDIKPYFASTDSVPDAHVGWHANRKR
jgi:tRNA (Thr-GGU) A37 N-methylase